MTLDLFLFAGEASGDLNGAHLLAALKELDPKLNIGGVGGPKMRAHAFDCFLPMEEFEVMGFTDILSSLPRLYRHFSDLKHHLLSSPPKGVVLIDYPGFNLRLARALRRKKCKAKIIQYSCPSVWAWGKWRIGLMNRSLDKLLALLPFEPEIFDRHSLKVDYIGHPIAEGIAKHSYDHNWRSHYGIAPKAPLFALFPGSREKELKRNFPLQIGVAKKLAREFSPLSLAISCASPKLQSLILPHLPPSAHLIPPRHSYELMRDAQLAIATSGTVALELALHQVPTVVTYAINSFDTLLARYLFRIHLPNYALPNLIAQKTIFPELFGPQLNSTRLEQKLREYLISEYKRQASISDCAHLKTVLGTRQTSFEAAKAILTAIKNPS